MSPKHLTPYRSYYWSDRAFVTHPIRDWRPTPSGVVSGRDTHGHGHVQLCILFEHRVIATDFYLEPTMTQPEVIVQLNRAKAVLEARRTGVVVRHQLEVL